MSMPGAGRIILVADDADPRWLGLRHERVTSTAVSALFGDSRYLSRAQLLEEKLGSLEGGSAGRLAAWGRLSQECNRKAICGSLGLISRGLSCMVGSPSLPLAATLDGLVRVPRAWAPRRTGLSSRAGAEDELQAALALKKEQTGLYEGKQVSLACWSESLSAEKMADWGKDGPRRDYWWQCQAAMHVTGYTWTFLAARIDAADYRGYVVDYDPEAGRRIEEETRRFWAEVELLR